MIHTVKGFGVVNQTELDVLLEFPSFLYDPNHREIIANVSNLTSGSNWLPQYKIKIFKKHEWGYNVSEMIGFFCKWKQ